jgi:outer membrane murein-binding lipoprotein Lpp
MNKYIALLFVSIIVLASVFVSGCSSQNNQKSASNAAYEHLSKINKDHSIHYGASYVTQTDNLLSRK